MRIVLNADDFGWSQDTVEATIECFERGALTSATIMVGKPATDQAVAFALAHPEYSFGVHLTFVSDGGGERPLAAPEEVPALVDEDGRLLPTNDVRRRAALRRLPAHQVEREVVSQLEALLTKGVRISHVDSHRHLHKYAVFRDALGAVLPQYAISRVRTAQDVYLEAQPTSPTYWFGRAWRRRLRARFASTDHFYMSVSHPAPAGSLILDAVGRYADSETLEIGIHPGSEEPWRARERDSALEVAGLALARGHRLISWHDVGES